MRMLIRVHIYRHTRGPRLLIQPSSLRPCVCVCVCDSHCASALGRWADLLPPPHVSREQRISGSQMCNVATELYYAKPLWSYGQSACVNCSPCINRASNKNRSSREARYLVLRVKGPLMCTDARHRWRRLQHSLNKSREGASVNIPAAS